MTSEAVIEAIRQSNERRKTAKENYKEAQKELAQKCVVAHSLGMSDREVAEAIGISRTRVQQLRSSAR